MLKIQINKEVSNETFPRGFELLRHGSDGRLLLGRRISGGFELISIMEDDFEYYDYNDLNHDNVPFELTSIELQTLSDKYLKNKK